MHCAVGAYSSRQPSTPTVASLAPVMIMTVPLCSNALRHCGWAGRSIVLQMLNTKLARSVFCATAQVEPASIGLPVRSLNHPAVALSATTCCTMVDMLHRDQAHCLHSISRPYKHPSAERVHMIRPSRFIANLNGSTAFTNETSHFLQAALAVRTEGKSLNCPLANVACLQSGFD
jgi:hypothetical protein